MSCEFAVIIFQAIGPNLTSLPYVDSRYCRCIWLVQTLLLNIHLISCNMWC